MLYRIVNVPPGYGPDEKYMVCAYRNTDLESKVCNLRNSEGSVFAATPEEARKMIPDGAICLTYLADELTIELWQAG